MAKTELNELQVKFLEALFGEAQGDAGKAKAIAGYADSTKTIDIVRALKEEIISQANLTLAIHSPKAALELVGLVIDPNQSGGTTKLKAIQEILNRVGVVGPKENSDVNLKVPQGGLFIMPAKNSNKEIDDGSTTEDA